MSRKVFIKTFGCQMNEYDSDKMADVLGAAQGYESTDDPEAADLILKGLDATIAQKVVTYDFARNMDGAKEVKTSEFADAIIGNMLGS